MAYIHFCNRELELEAYRYTKQEGCLMLFPVVHRYCVTVLFAIVGVTGTGPGLGSVEYGRTVHLLCHQANHETNVLMEVIDVVELSCPVESTAVTGILQTFLQVIQTVTHRTVTGTDEKLEIMTFAGERRVLRLGDFILDGFRGVGERGVHVHMNNLRLFCNVFGRVRCRHILGACLHLLACKAHHYAAQSCYKK